MLKKIAKMARMSAVLISLLAIASGCESPSAPIAGLVKIATGYKIEVISTDPVFPVATTHGAIAGKAAESGELRRYVRLFAPEFALYPTGLVGRAKLDRVVLCKGLSFGGQLRGAIPDYEHRTLYLDVESGSYNKSYQIKVFHHEFFHIVDYLDDGIVYGDDQWTSMNPATFRYGTGGKAAQGLAMTSLLTDEFPGFLNHYSTTGVEEDKAEVFANLIVDPSHVEAKADKDTVLKAKVERMKALLADFCPEMNAKFWEKTRATKRDADGQARSSP